MDEMKFDLKHSGDTGTHLPYIELVIHMHEIYRTDRTTPELGNDLHRLRKWML